MDGLCETCRAISIEDLKSIEGVTLDVHPGRCRFCALIFTALKSCGCGLKWEIRESTGGIFRRTFYDECVYGLDKLGLGGVTKLWARPFDDVAAAPPDHAPLPLERRLEGVTVCYGRTGVIEGMKTGWPAKLHDVEAGRNHLAAAVFNLTYDAEAEDRRVRSNATHVCSGSLVFTASFGSPIANLLQYRTPGQSADSEAQYNILGDWIKNCIENHDACKTPVDTVTHTPSRLIDVKAAATNGDIQLVELNDRAIGRSQPWTSPYTALSYCWGPTDEHDSTPLGYCTTSENVEQRKAGLSVHDLPKTIQDAIIITQRLGIDYLWVDALCILQGSDPEAKDDWSRESMKMRSIYGGALVTIAAASARSADQGIFDLYQPQPPPASPTKLNLTSKSHGISSSEVLATLLSVVGPQDEPLYHRGWTLQERILTPRVVVYNRDQLLWECQSTNLSLRGSPMDSVITMRLPKKCPSEELQNRWQVIVTDYTARDLTQSRDKLPAISGLAQAFQAQMPANQYLAGLWRDSLLDDLLWMHAPTFTARLATRARPSVYRAPSWSWASLDGNVRWGWAVVRNRKIPRYNIYTAEIISCRTVLKGPDQFGEVLEGRLVLKGQMRPLRRDGIVHVGYHPKYLEEETSLSIYLDHVLLEGRHCRRAKAEELEGLGDVRLLSITSHQALLLLRTEELEGGDSNRPAEYVRIGVAAASSLGLGFAFHERRLGWDTAEVEIV